MRLTPSQRAQRSKAATSKSILNKIASVPTERARNFINSYNYYKNIKNKDDKLFEGMLLWEQYPEYITGDNNYNISLREQPDLNINRILARPATQPENRVIAFLRQENNNKALIPSPENNTSTTYKTYKINFPYIVDRSNGITNVPSIDDLSAIESPTDAKFCVIVEFDSRAENIQENKLLYSKNGQYWYQDKRLMIVHFPTSFNMSSNVFTPKRAEKLISILVGQYPEGKNYYIRVFKDELLPRRFQLFTSTISSNCVLDIIEKYIVSNPNYLKKSKKISNPLIIFNDIKSRLLEENAGFMHKHAEEVYSKLHLKLRIFHNNGLWYSKESKSNHKIITIFAHDKHASEYKKIQKIKKVQYIPLSDEIKEYGLTVENHLPTVIHGKMMLISEYNWETDESVKKPCFHIDAYHQEDTIYKTFRPPSPDDTNPDYYSCTSELSYIYKKWKLNNNLSAPSEPFFSLIKSASHLIGAQRLLEYDNAKKYHHTDINKAYPSFKSNKLYSKFKLPLGYFDFGKIDDSPLSIVSTTGWSIINNVQIKSPLLQKINYIQNSNIYTHVRLYHLLSNNLATFDIVATITSRSEDIDFPFDESPSAKFRNNAFVGMLIASNQYKKKYFTANDELELEQIRFDASKEDNYVNSVILSNKFLEISFANSADKDKVQFYNIHSYIIDYAQCTLIDAMVANYDKNIICFHTDGFYTEKPTDVENSNKWGEFKKEFKKINYIALSESKTHVLNYELSNNLPIIPLNNTHTLTIGPPGCGKSRSMFTNTRFNSVITCPTHKLKLTHSATMASQSPRSVGGMGASPLTYHKFFGIGVSEYAMPSRPNASNVYIDECSMIPTHHFNLMLEFATKHRINLHFIGDIDEKGIHQLPPVSLVGSNTTPLKLSDFRDFSIIRANNAERRQNKEDCELLDSLRNLDFQIQLESIKNCEKIKHISAEECVGISGIGIVATHARANLLNEIMFKDSIKNKKPIKLRSTTTSKKNGQVVSPKGQLSEISYEEYQKNKSKLDSLINRTRKHSSDVAPAGTIYELGYFNTCDSVQGATIDCNIIIDLVGADRENLLYTAITRATDLNNVYLIC